MSLQMRIFLKIVGCGMGIILFIVGIIAAVVMINPRYVFPAFGIIALGWILYGVWIIAGIEAGVQE
jgi:hypothetical protein